MKTYLYYCPVCQADSNFEFDLAVNNYERFNCPVNHESHIIYILLENGEVSFLSFKELNDLGYFRLCIDFKNSMSKIEIEKEFKYKSIDLDFSFSVPKSLEDFNKRINLIKTFI